MVNNLAMKLYTLSVSRKYGMPKVVPAVRQNGIRREGRYLLLEGYTLRPFFVPVGDEEYKLVVRIFFG